jgi:hypothetical protein
MMAAFMAAMENSIVATAMPDDRRQAFGGFHVFSWAFARLSVDPGDDYYGYGGQDY